jgi:L-idonate 5-dehydrogenase
MRAIILHETMDLRVEECEISPPGPGEVQVRIAAGGICGSDLHYYQHGGFGTVRIKEPMILGHEVSGHVAALGEGVSELAIGDLVAVSPSRPCGRCRYCQAGMRNQCLNMRFYGSAMPFPHIQGAFRELLNCDATQCVPAVGLTSGEAALAEPFSVVLHAARQAGDLMGARVLVTGCGPIGALAVAEARRAGAVEIVATDIADAALDLAGRLGADRTINVRSDPKALDSYLPNKGYFDAMFECSGAPAALAQGITVMRPRGVVVQIGLGGDMNVPMQLLTSKELRLHGTFRFHEEFPLAVEFMRSGLVDLKPMISHTLTLDRAVEAFDLAGDRSQAMKVQIAFNA